ncbi:hypothetical protein DES36_12219 [Alkalibaculum bacchi]|uniref:Pyridinium-3,5-bisthiocarboxylic acid mononucleotide nickel insertion protein n=1 Tax=Alkalibaculum bacchi TaxID=645887 RepID=A0A366HZX0_9FIRM|nr:nickel pincer cofactor biosynthesis protein LarC [Alkalibaculum bacchi]RBP58594.1 hypothetical protein DES36_12219 [Alkalibaculum bacchi]
MKNILYLECYSGISGDMTVAALLDLGADEETLLQGLKSLNIDGYKIKISQTSKCGICAKDFNVILEEHHKQHHFHRNIKDINQIISSSNITQNAKEIALKTFKIIAEAEAKVHGKSIEEVHFHEVGAIDSIVDIVAVAICIDNLKIEQVIVSPIYEGHGHVKCQHGIIPVPVPAVVEIAKGENLQLKLTDTEGEMVTPTGAAIVAALKTRNQLPKNYIIEKIGIGAGKKDFPKANILRAYILQAIDNNEDQVILLRCNIDDMTGEELGFALEVIIEEGALDANFTPIFMKKNRPAYELTVICKEEDHTRLKKVIFKYTTTLGIRAIPSTRSIMKRTITNFSSTLGEVKIKEAKYEDITKRTIEYEDAKKIAKEHNLSVGEVFRTIYSELRW